MTTPTRLRGWIVQDPRIAESALLASGAVATFASSYTQEGRYPGVPSPTGQPELLLSASGTMPDYDLDLAIQRGGYSEPDGATLRWKKRTDNSSTWRGWNPPKTLMGCEVVESALNLRNQYPDAVALPTGEIVCVVRRVTIATDDIYAWTRSTAGAWTKVLISSGALTTYDRQATICMREWADPTRTPHLYCFHLEDTNTGTENQISASRSTDGGATWATYATGVLPTDISSSYDLTYLRLRSLVVNDQILLLFECRKATAAGNYENILLQYASDDLGNTFALVSEWTGSGSQVGRYFEPVLVNGEIHVYCIDPLVEAAQQTPAKRVIANAFDNLADVSPEAVNVGGVAWGVDFASIAGAAPNIIIGDGDLAATVLRDGSIWIYLRKVAAPYYHLTIVSYDQGGTWQYPSKNNVNVEALWYFQADVNSHPVNFKAIEQGGRVVMMANSDSVPAAMDFQLFALALGGWTLLPLQHEENAWGHTWVPIDAPQDAAPDTAAGAGAETVSIADGFMVVTTAAGQTRAYTYARAHSNFGMHAELILQRVSGGASGTAQIGMQMTSDDGVNLYQIIICVDGTSVYVRDGVAAAQIGTVALTTTAPFAIMATISNGTGANDGQCKVWACAMGTAGLITEDQSGWTSVVSSTTLQRAATVAAGDTFEWGHVAAAAGATESRWWFRGYLSITNLTDLVTSGWVNPTNLVGGPVGYRSWVAGGCLVTGKAGPAMPGDTWTLDREWRYAVTNLLADQAVAKSWRTTADNVETFIGFDMADGLNDDAYQASGSIGVMLIGINFKSCILEGWTVAGAAWTTIGTVNPLIQLDGLAYTREGGTIQPSAAANPANTRYIQHNELVGATIDFGGGVLRRVDWNTGGRWKGSTIGSVKRPVIHCTGALAGDPASGSCDIWARNVMAVFHTGGTAYRGLRLRITAHDTVDNYYECHTAIVGPFIPVGWEWSTDTSVEVQPQVTRTTHRDGSSRAVVQGKPYRALTCTWADAVDTTDLYRLTTPEPILNSSVQLFPVGTESDAASLLQGLMSSDMRTNLVGYVRRCDSGTAAGDVYQTSDREAFACVRVVTGPEWSGTLGNEAEDQVLTASTMEMIEEVEP